MIIHNPVGQQVKLRRMQHAPCPAPLTACLSLEQNPWDLEGTSEGQIVQLPCYEEGHHN